MMLNDLCKKKKSRIAYFCLGPLRLDEVSGALYEVLQSFNPEGLGNIGARNMIHHIISVPIPFSIKVEIFTLQKGTCLMYPCLGLSVKKTGRRIMLSCNEYGTEHWVSSSQPGQPYFIK